MAGEPDQGGPMEGTKGRAALPSGWAWTTLGEIATLVGGGTPTRERPDYFQGDVVWLTPTEIPKDRIAVITDSKERITKEALSHSSARIIPKGSVLMTSRASIGYVAIAGDDVTTNQGFASFICEEGVYYLFLAYWLWANAGVFKDRATGTTFKEITKSKLRPFDFPIAPFPEQQRIVAKIEEILSQLDAGVALLNRAQANLKRYKASVLQAACEGRLVPQYPDDEPASALFERLVADRRVNWEADLRAMGKDPKEAKYREPELPDAEGLSVLPKGWCWTTLGSIAESMKNGIYKPPGFYRDGGVACLRMYNINDGQIVWKNVERMRLTAAEIFEYKLDVGDILVNRVNSRELVGKSATIPSGLETCVFESKNIRLRLLQGASLGDYVKYWLLAYGPQYFSTNSQQTVGMASVNQKQLARMPIPIPPIAEQLRIVEEAERCLTLARHLEHACARAFLRANRLRQAILRKAFIGYLVPQDPTDEPASLQLERIKAARLASESARKRRRGSAVRRSSNRRPG